MIEQAGFDAVYMTGFGAAASLLGRPDVGLLTATEMVDNARRIVAATDLPVIADADTGYGNPINTIRTVQDYERAGLAGLHIEDQVAPKKCGHMEGKQVIPARELADVSLLFNWAEGGKTPPLTLDRLTELGFAMVIMPISTLLAATQGMQAVLASIKTHGTPIAALPNLPTFADFTTLIGLPEITTLESRFH